MTTTMIVLFTMVVMMNIFRLRQSSFWLWWWWWLQWSFCTQICNDVFLLKLKYNGWLWYLLTQAMSPTTLPPKPRLTSTTPLAMLKWTKNKESAKQSADYLWMFFSKQNVCSSQKMCEKEQNTQQTIWVVFTRPCVQHNVTMTNLGPKETTKSF